jgi:hypothetical protein
MHARGVVKTWKPDLVICVFLLVRRANAYAYAANRKFNRNDPEPAPAAKAAKQAAHNRYTLGNTPRRLLVGLLYYFVNKREGKELTMAKAWWWDHKFEDKDVEKERMNKVILEGNTREGQETLTKDLEYIRSLGYCPAIAPVDCSGKKE